jgi:hypothetical protein
VRLGERTVDSSRRVLRTRGGPIYNSFPIRYYEPGTRRVARPRLAPPVEWSPIVTPKLPATKP